MSSTRRGFLGWLAALPIIGQSRNTPDVSQPSRAFPFMERFHPLKPGEGEFKKPDWKPSFLHPNKRWVVLPDSKGGFEIWDWRAGTPLRSLGGSYPGDAPAEYCDNWEYHPGVFIGHGRAWVAARIGVGGNDGSEVMGAATDGSAAWKVNMSLRPDGIQLDPYRPMIYHFGYVPENLNEIGLVSTSALTGYQSFFDMNRNASRDGFNTTILRISNDGRWLLAHQSHKLEPHAGYWVIWSVPDGWCRAFREALFVKSTDWAGFSSTGSTVFMAGANGWIPWNWAGRSTTEDQPFPSWSPERMDVQEVKIDGGKTTLIRRGQGIMEARSTPANKLLRRLIAFPPSPQLVAFGPKRNHVIAAEPSGAAWLWNRTGPIRPMPAMLEGELSRPAYSVIHSEGVRSLMWSRDGSKIAIGESNGTVNLYDAKAFRIPTGSKADDAALEGPHWSAVVLQAPIRAMGWVENGIAVLGFDGTIAILDPDTGATVKKWKAHPHRAQTMAASADGRMLITGGLDGVAVWSLPGGRELGRFAKDRQGATCVDAHPKAARVSASFIDGSVAFFELPKGRMIWDQPEAHRDVASGVAIHPSGDWVVSQGWDGRMQGWEVATGLRRSESFEGKAAPGSSLAWSRDGERLAAGPSIHAKDLSLGKGPEYHLNFRWDEECT